VPKYRPWSLRALASFGVALTGRRAVFATGGLLDRRQRRSYRRHGLGVGHGGRDHALDPAGDIRFDQGDEANDEVLNEGFHFGAWHFGASIAEVGGVGCNLSAGPPQPLFAEGTAPLAIFFQSRSTRLRRAWTPRRSARMLRTSNGQNPAGAVLPPPTTHPQPPDGLSVAAMPSALAPSRAPPSHRLFRPPWHR